MHREKPVLESLFNKVADLQTFRIVPSLKKDSDTCVFPENIAKCLRTPTLKNMCERLLLHVEP